MPPDRLSTIDASFLQIETPSAHMHVGWRGSFRPARGRPVSVEAVRALVEGRLRHAPRFRQRLAFPPGGLAEPVWVDDARFDLGHHVRALSEPHDALARARFAQVADDFLSTPLPRDRPLWQIGVAPRLRSGGVGVVMKVHHSMVDGKSAVALALLLLDADPASRAPPPDREWRPQPAPTPARLALDAIVEQSTESLRSAAGLARMAGSPRGGVRLAESLRRAALSAGEDLLRPAPASFLNVPIGPARRLLTHSAPLSDLLEIRARQGVTLNDVALALVAGALRRLALARATLPLPIKVMVPVSTRAEDEAGALGNRISFVFIRLPVNVGDPLERLALINAATLRFKREGRAAGGESVLGALGRMPAPVRRRAAQLAASSRMYNMTASNVPGPRVPVYLLGAELLEAYPVVPLSDGHALSIGMFSYGTRMFFGALADPHALPDAGRLPGALNASRAELAEVARAQAPPRGWEAEAVTG